MTDIAAIETVYDGIGFRSRLEARWAVFLNVHGIEWLYEPEGYELPSGRYLPDFYLPECATFLEVRGDPGRVNLTDLNTKANELPQQKPTVGEPGPKLMLLGPIPRPIEVGDYGWLSFDGVAIDGHPQASRYGFGTWHKNKRPWWHADDSTTTTPLTPTIDKYEWSAAFDAYTEARSYRFWNPK